MTNRSRWALGPALIAVSSVAVGALVVAAPSATAVAPASCDVSNDYTLGDVDNDFVADSVVGVPNNAGSRGAVDVRLSGGGAPRLVTRSSVTGLGTSTPGDRFGSAVALGDLNRDGCDDLVVGAAGEAGGGAVHLVFGDVTGVRATGGVTITEPGGVHGDGFGSTVALVGHDYDATWSLWVGAPNRKVGGDAGAGAIYHYRLNWTGSSIDVALIQTITQDTAGVPDSAEAGDHFGGVLAADGYEVIVGVPYEDVGSHSNAGKVFQLVPAGAAVLTSARAYSQNSAGVPGSAKKADRFGAAVSTSGFVAVGIPGEDVHGRTNTGAVQLFARGTAGLSPKRLVTQNSTLAGRAVPGNNERGDAFGSSVSLGVAYLCQEELDLAVGAPGEDVGKHRDAGAVTVVGIVPPGARACAPRGLSQGRGLVGTAEKGDRVGATLTNRIGRIDFDEDRADHLFVGAPGEKLGAADAAGVVEGPGSSTFASVSRTGGNVAGTLFGSVLAGVAVGTWA